MKKIRARRLIFICQSINPAEHVHQTTIEWIKALASIEHYDYIKIITLRAGDNTFANLKKVEVAKIKQTSAAVALFSFYSHIFNDLNRKTDIFIFQNGPYIALLLPLRLAGFKIYQWLSHPAKNLFSYLSILGFANYVFTSASKALPIMSKRVEKIGVGINTSIFTRTVTDCSTIQYQFCTVGRISKSKNLLSMVELIKELKNQGLPNKSVLIGSPMTKEDERYEVILTEAIHRHGLASDISVKKAMSQKDLVKILSSSRFFINLSSTAADKAALEAMALGIPIFTNNENLAEYIPEKYRHLFFVNSHSVPVLVQKIQAILKIPPEEQKIIKELMSKEITANHSVSAKVGQVIKKISGKGS